MESDKLGFLASLKGIVQTLEQKSGLNPLLYLDAIIGVPAIVGYAFSEKGILLWFAGAPLTVTVLFYGISFFTDKNFLRSEKYVYDMRRLDILGEKGKEFPETETLDIPPTTDPAPKKKELKG